MQKLKFYFLAAATLLLTSCHKDILNDIDDLKNRVTNLETLCAQMNADISSLQAIVEAQSSNDMISGVEQTTNGYTITFTSGKTIMLYNGKDGIDGKNGKDGAGAYSPTISVAQDVDGIYYWTLDGNFLLDNDGNKLPVTGEKGAQGDKGDTGIQGNDGGKGEQGVAGNDGITPQLKIDGGKWYVSYDNKATWTEIGQATGDKGDTGSAGTSLFSAVDEDENFVYFTLADGTKICVEKSNGNSEFYTLCYDANGGEGTMQSEKIYAMKTTSVKDCAFARTDFAFARWNTKADGTGVSFLVGETIVLRKNVTLYAQWSGKFSVSSSTQVIFAPGNLQYQPSTGKWRFAMHQYDCIGTANENIGDTYTGWLDLFGWGTGDAPTQNATNLSEYAEFNDWGKNVISGYASGTWRTLSNDEWDYLLQTRNNAASLYGFATIDNVAGLVLLPDAWATSANVSFKTGKGNYGKNVYTAEEWQLLEAAGGVFLPAAGLRNVAKISNVQTAGYYWTSTGSATNSNDANRLYFGSQSTEMSTLTRYFGTSVRLAK